MTKQTIFKNMKNDVAWAIKYDNTFLNKSGKWNEKDIIEIIERWKSRWHDSYIDYISERVFQNMVMKTQSHFLLLLKESNKKSIKEI